MLPSILFACQCSTRDVWRRRYQLCMQYTISCLQIHLLAQLYDQRNPLQLNPSGDFLIKPVRRKCSKICLNSFMSRGSRLSFSKSSDLVLMGPQSSWDRHCRNLWVLDTQVEARLAIWSPGHLGRPTGGHQQAGDKMTNIRPAGIHRQNYLKNPTYK